MTRPSYQAGSVSRMVLAGVALWNGSPDWQESSVKSVNAFIYTRLLIKYIGPLMKTTAEDVPSQQGVYKYVFLFPCFVNISYDELGRRLQNPD